MELNCTVIYLQIALNGGYLGYIIESDFKN